MTNTAHISTFVVLHAIINFIPIRRRPPVSTTGSVSSSITARKHTHYYSPLLYSLSLMGIATSHAKGFQDLAPGEVKAVPLFKLSSHATKMNFDTDE